MHLFSLSLLLACVQRPVFSAPYSYGPPNTDLDIEFEPGSNVHGFIDPANPSTRQFLGIPYAKPPVGDLRWAAPEPIGKLGDLQVKTMPPSCFQILTPPTNDPNALEEYNARDNLSEDCLTLSVWAPKVNATDAKLPVLIWIYGGGFGSGGQDVPYQIPTQWVDRTKKHIVVSFNYRLNVFGFPDSTGLQNYNFGLLDQRLVVEWVSKNIGAFGGDASRIVLFGESAGGVSIGHYSYAYPTNPLVSGLIMQSGTEYLIAGKTINATETSFSDLAAQVGCGNLSPPAELACMRKVPASVLEQSLTPQSSDNVLSSLATAFIPVVDNRTVYGSEKAGLPMAKLPAIVGNNRNEFDTLIPGIGNDVSVFTWFFRCIGWHTTQLRGDVNLPTFRYEYNGNFPNVSPNSRGAYHTSELPMLFGTYGNYRGASTQHEIETSQAMQDNWVAFASGGAEALKKSGWYPYDEILRRTRYFGTVLFAQVDLPAEVQVGRCAVVGQIG